MAQRTLLPLSGKTVAYDSVWTSTETNTHLKQTCLTHPHRRQEVSVMMQQPKGSSGPGSGKLISILILFKLKLENRVCLSQDKQWIGSEDLHRFISQGYGGSEDM